MSFFVVSFACGEFNEACSSSDDAEAKSDKSASQTLNANRNGKADDTPVPSPKDNLKFIFKATASLRSSSEDICEQ